MKLIQFEPLFIRDFKTDVWPFPLHNHNHYELMYIRKGAGEHMLNGINEKYTTDNFFFLKPEDKHDFIIKEETHFSTLKFLPGVLKNGINSCSTDFWDNLLSSVIRGCQKQNEWNNKKSIKKRVKTIVEILVNDWHDNNEKVTEVQTNLLRALLLLLEKGLRGANESNFANVGNSPIDRIQNYIHSYIYYPEKLSVKELSNVFRMSESGIKTLFKREMGISLRVYIGSLKLQMIKDRIKNSSVTLSEIAQDFGFTDSSHLYRFFMAKENLNPLAFRKGEQS